MLPMAFVWDERPEASVGGGATVRVFTVRIGSAEFLRPPWPRSRLMR